MVENTHNELRRVFDINVSLHMLESLDVMMVSEN
jgi:hypothetical protein